VRAAYSDYLPRDAILWWRCFVTLAPQEVDAMCIGQDRGAVRNAGLVRALIVHALKDGLAREGKRTARTATARPSLVPSVIRAGAPIGTGGARRPIRSDRARI